VLANTLGNNQKRGQWGEMHLSKLLEELGMQEGVDYEKQTKTVNDEGQPIKPDVIVRMTEGRFMAVDAKVPLSYFAQASQIGLEKGDEGEAERKTLLQKHLGAVKKHIDDISSKAYHSGLAASPEFTLLYIPTETVYSATLELDNSLLDYAFKKHVVLVSPSSLYASLKAVMYSWQQHVQEDFIKEVLTIGQTLFKNLSVMADHIQDVGKGLKKMVTSYNSFIGSVETKFLKPVTQLNEENSRALSSQDSLPQLEAVDVAVREVTKNELMPPSKEHLE
jgi:DNA recombination protein RmuC